MNLVDEDDLAVALAELVFRINKDEALLGGYLGAALEECARVALHYLVVFGADDALCYDFLARDVLVVTLVGLGGRGDDGLWEALVLAHSVGQLHAAELAASVLILAPS